MTCINPTLPRSATSSFSRFRFVSCPDLFDEQKYDDGIHLVDVDGNADEDAAPVVYGAKSYWQAILTYPPIGTMLNR
jgi:hypothetical protein